MADDSDDNRARIRSELGASIRRTRADVTQAALATSMATTQSAVSAWEKGQVALSVEQLLQIEHVLGVPYGSILVDAGVLQPAKLWRFDAGAIRSYAALDEKTMFRLVRAAVELGMGVRVWNQTVDSPDNPESVTEEWMVVVAGAPAPDDSSIPSE